MLMDILPLTAAPENGGALYATLMGDLIASEAAASVSRLHQSFNAAIARANAAPETGILSPLTVTLGDEFQGICANLSQGARLMRRLRADLLEQGVECRFVLGLVRLETPLNRERAWNMMGPGLAAAREKLSDKRDPNAYRFHLPGGAAIEQLLEAVGAGLSAVEAGWTERQREIVLAAATGDVAANAKRFGVSPKTVYKIRQAAQYDLYTRQWAAVDVAVRSLDGAYGLS